MFRVWANILVRPRVRIDAAGQGAAAPLIVTLALIVAVNVVAVLLGLAEGWALNQWVVPTEEIDQIESPSETMRKLMNSGVFMFYVVRMTDMGLWFMDLYGELWVMLWNLSVPSFQFASKLIQDVFFFVRDIEWLYEGRRVLFNPVYFLMGMGVRHWLARAMGGQGRFGRYAYLFMLFGIPLTLLSSLLEFVPLVGPVVETVYPVEETARLAMYQNASAYFGQYWFYTLENVPVAMARWLLSFYSIGLACLATRAEHGLTWWLAVVVAVVGYVAHFFISNSLFYLFLGLARFPQLMP